MSVIFSTYLNSVGKKIHTFPRCGLVTIQIDRHILCSIRFWPMVWFCLPRFFFHTNAVLKSCTFYTGSIVALLDLIFKLQYLMNYSSNFNNFADSDCEQSVLHYCSDKKARILGPQFLQPFLKCKQCFMKT